MSSNPNPQASFRLLCDQIEQAMQRFPVPGVAVGVLLDGEEYTAGFGVTRITNPLPVTDETLFQIGSTTKTVTGTLAMRLVEEGKLDLDVPKIVAVAGGYTGEPGTQTFQDVPLESAFYKWVENLAAVGAVGGYACGGQGEPCVPPLDRP